MSEGLKAGEWGLLFCGRGVQELVSSVAEAQMRYARFSQPRPALHKGKEARELTVERTETAAVCQRPAPATGDMPPGNDVQTRLL